MFSKNVELFGKMSKNVHVFGKCRTFIYLVRRLGVPERRVSYEKIKLSVSSYFVLVFLLVLASVYRTPFSHHPWVAASTIWALPIWTATARAVVMCDIKPPGSAVYLEHFRSKVRDLIPSCP